MVGECVVVIPAISNFQTPQTGAQIACTEWGGRWCETRGITLVMEPDAVYQWAVPSVNYGNGVSVRKMCLNFRGRCNIFSYLVLNSDGVCICGYHAIGGNSRLCDALWSELSARVFEMKCDEYF